jgi:hypothetical protein
MDTILDMIRDQAWQFVGAIIGLVTLVVSTAIYLRRRERKDLSYEILASEPLLTVSEVLTGEIKVTYQDTEIRDAHLLIIKVTNSGNVPIRQEDFELPLAFSFGSEAQVLSYEVIESPPQGLQTSLRRSGGGRGIVLNPLLLNPSDAVILKFILAQYTGKLVPTSRVVGVKQVRCVTEPKSRIDEIPIAYTLVFSVILIVINTAFNIVMDISVGVRYSPNYYVGRVCSLIFSSSVTILLVAFIAPLLDRVSKLIQASRSTAEKTSSD